MVHCVNSYEFLYRWIKLYGALNTRSCNAHRCKQLTITMYRCTCAIDHKSRRNKNFRQQSHLQRSYTLYESIYYEDDVF